MGKIGIYVERYTISNSFEMNALLRFGLVARKFGHRADFLFRPDMFKIPEYDAIFIRSLTDPLNSSFVAARIAEMHGLRVIDDPDSIIICCDKVNMYQHVKNAGIPLPKTIFMEEPELNKDYISDLFKNMGKPLVLKAPNSSFSMYVDKAETVEEFIKIGKRFFRRADRIVVQNFIKSSFDWRVGVLNGEVLYVCQYIMPKKSWKILTYTANGTMQYGPVKGVEIDKANPLLLERAIGAAKAIGSGFYGIDLKEVDNDFVVIEVNDNPTIMAGDEDQKASGLYEKIIKYLLNE